MKSHISGNTPIQWQRIEVLLNDKNFKNIKTKTFFKKPQNKISLIEN